MTEQKLKDEIERLKKLVVFKASQFALYERRFNDEREKVERLQAELAEERRAAIQTISFMCAAFEQIETEAPWFQQALAAGRTFLEARRKSNR